MDLAGRFLSGILPGMIFLFPVGPACSVKKSEHWGSINKTLVVSVTHQTELQYNYNITWYVVSVKLTTHININKTIKYTLKFIGFISFLSLVLCQTLSTVKVVLLLLLCDHNQHFEYYATFGGYCTVCLKKQTKQKPHTHTHI